MLLNYIFIALILLAVIAGLIQCFLTGDTSIFSEILCCQPLFYASFP